MKPKQTFFFAEHDDIVPIIKQFELEFDVKYYETGLFDSRTTKSYSSLLELSTLGTARNGDWNQCESYLVLPVSMTMIVREIPQRKGGTKYAIDQLKNNSCIELKPAGVFNDKVIVAGSVNTLSSDDFATNAYNLFSKLVKKNFKKVDNFYVGSNALDKLQKGWRLVTNETSPTNYDLKL